MIVRGPENETLPPPPRGLLQTFIISKPRGELTSSETPLPIKITLKVI